MRVFIAVVPAILLLCNAHQLSAQVSGECDFRGRFGGCGDWDTVALIMRVVVPIGFGVLFYRVATLERRAGWFWAIVSLLLSLIALQLRGIGLVIVFQIGLFIAMWVSNFRRGLRWSSVGKP